MNNYWSTYWQQGKLHSFADAPGQNYDGDLAQHWRNFFAEYKNKTASIVDIGCGNGALFELALRHQQMDNVTFTGVDTATLSVPDALDKPNVRFLENCPAEHTGLESGSVDAVVSQFGIEYSDTEQSFIEVARILRPGGKIRVVVHDNNSMIIKRNARTLAAVEALLGPASAIDALRKLSNALDKYGKQSSSSEQARRHLNQLTEQMVKTHGQQAVLDTNFSILLKTVLSSSHAKSDKKAALRAFEKEMKGHQQRLMQLVNAAYSAEDKKQTQTKLEALHFENIRFTDVKENNQLIGCEIQATKQ
ncbi:class I SAM-dependent methyltransferase [Alteromonas halophila]|uniref:Methyltransferase type 11 domain-containing protein n=1 Tax=Alteromonas halophila TaxID=516698 RepID=A0A918MVK4_9ALTE|nr:class I SAM-dependent methyltransferase [Alteromonas halophila]GGW74026.1 hypothetical protein GCM10007391_02250 [Alteromonas halophila]